MLRKLILTEIEKKQISNLHRLLNEEDGFATLQGYVRHKLIPKPNSQVKLFQNEKLIKGATTDENGFFKIESIPLGKYHYKITNKVEGYDDFEDDIDLSVPKVYDVKLSFRDTQSTKEVVVTVERDKSEKICLIDVSVFDEENKPIGPCKIYIYNQEDELITKDNTNQEGVGNNIRIPYNKNKGFVRNEKIYKPCEEKYTIKIQAEFDGKKSNVQSEEICIYNGNADRITFTNKRRSILKNRNGEVTDDFSNSNIIKIKMDTIFDYNINVVDSEDKKYLSDATITLYLDKERTNEIGKSKGELTGNINLERRKIGKFESDIEVYYKIECEKYDTEVGKIKIKRKGDNSFTIPLDKEYLNFKYRLENVVDNENESLSDVKFKIYGDRSKEILLKEGIVPSNGKIKRDKDRKNELENTKIVFVEISKEGYITSVERVKLTMNKDENKYSFRLNKVKPPPPEEPPKPPSERECIRLTMKHYRNMENVDAGNITINDLGGVDGIKKNAEVVKACYVKYMKEYPRRMEKTINRLKNVQSELDFFKLRFTNQEIRSIYGESRTMLLKNTIRKVVSESVENKSEKILIEERLKFSLTGLNKKNSSEVKRALRNERYSLINFGYNKELVRESFLDVMKGLYGNDETNVLTDIKTRLGQRIADQVKNKQEEHEMILSAFNELSEDMIERAIKENRVDELSTEIATKALEIYKTQFGTEGLSGIMIASVDENKFKQEVAKLIEPAIKEITTKMDEKLKQVQDAVSGGINPTA
jgi:hypothetical protein